jgi:hypothetical protein
VSTTVLEHDDRPTVAAGGLAVAAAVLAVIAVANNPPQLAAIVVEVVAVVALAVGAFLHGAGRTAPADEPADAGSSVVALLLLGVGVAAAVLAPAIALVNPIRMSARLELFPGVLGVTLVTLGVLPVRRWKLRPRYLVGSGAALLVVGAFTSGVVFGADAFALLVATALAVVAWDAGEQAVTLGAHVGRRGETATVALGHVGATLLVGLAGVTIAWAIYAVNVTGIPLLALVLLLGAAVVLAVALYA